MSKTRLDQLSPEQRKLLALRLKTRRAAEAEDAPPAAAEGAGGEYPLSYPQQRLWMLDRLQPGSAAYNVPSAIRVRDTLRPEDVERAIDEIVRRHGVLRTRFEQRGAESVQVVEPHRPFTLPVHDLRGMDEARAEAELTRIANDEAQAPFDLAAGPPFRARMATMGPRDHTIFATFHHIVTDGWSNDVFWRELSQLVAAYEDGTPYPLQPLPMQFGEYARRQRERLSEEAMDAMAAWWKRELDGAPHRLELPTDRPRPAVLSDRGGHVALDLPAGLADRIARFAVAEEATPFIVLLAAYHLLLGRCAGTDDVLVGSAIGGRTTRDVEPLIGFFANTLAIRGRFDDDPSFRALVARVRRTMLGAYEHQEMPFDRLVDELGVERTLSGSPLVQTVFLVHNRPPGDHVDDGTLEALQQDVGASKFDVTASVALGPDRAVAGAEFSADLFDAASIRRMLVHYGALLDAALADPDAPVSTLPMLAPGERDRVLTAFASGPRAADTDRSVHALFAAQASASPERTALSWDGGTMSFAALDAAANRLANHLRATGIRPGARVGVMLERGPDLVVTLLAALKAGAAYVPLDPSYPAERRAWMMADARLDLLVTDTTTTAEAHRTLDDTNPPPGVFGGGWASGASPGGGAAEPAEAHRTLDGANPPPGFFGGGCEPRRAGGGAAEPADAHRSEDDTNPPPGVFGGGWASGASPGGGAAEPADAPPPPPVLHLSAARDAIADAPDTDPRIDAGPDALAYVVYTSGSTGTPKGVAVPHRGIVRLVRGGGFAELGPDETFLQLAPASFDAATLEVWAPLLNGGRLALAPAGTPTPRELAETVRREGVTTLWLTAGLFHLVAAEAPEAFAGVRQLLAGGDVLSPAHVRRVTEAHPGLRVINGYGPTENTTFTACRTISEDDLARASVPIGSPIAGTTAYVVDRRMAPAPVGVPGELLAGGDGLAWGYLGRPGLTAERFVPDPFGVPGSRLYRTGDRVRWLEEGGLEFLGRMDQQVKVRGFRIEPGEVEAALKAVPGVRDAVVAARADGGGEKRLVAYVVGGDGAAPSAAELRDALAPRLPAHMIPSAFVALEAVPLTPNGKVDRRALPAPIAPEADGRFAAPRTPTEEVLAGAWAELLGVPRVGAEDDFFLLGGHSLIATQVVSRVREAFGVELPLRALFEAPVLSAFAARVDAAMRDEAGMAAPPLVRVAGDDLPLSFAQERLWFIDRLEPGSPVYNMPFPLRLRGALDVAALERAMGEVVRRHESLRTRFPVVDGAPVQRIAPFDGFTLPLDTLEGDEDAREAEAAAAADAWSALPFDLTAGPLFRARLLRIAPEDHLLLVGMHHVVSDGWSMGVFWRELITLYHAFRRGEPSPLPPLPLRYADFAAWQRAWLSGETLERQVAWWRAHLAGAPALLAVPTDRPRPPTQSHRGAGHAFALPPEVAEPLRALARAEGATLFMAILAAWDLLLSRWSGQEDVVVGTPVAGRTRRETEGMIGFFVNTLAIRADLSGDPSFRALLHRVREATLGAYAHQDLPFERLVEELQPERSLAHAPVYQVMLVLQNLPEGPSEGFEGVEIGGAGGHTGVAKVDLTLGMMEAPDGGLAGAVEYATDLFDEATAARMSRHLANLLAAAVADPDAPVSALPMLDAGEREAVRTMGAAARAFSVTGTLHERFAARAARTPDAVAVTFGGETVTFGALDARADALARRLRARGAGPEVLVGLCVERSVETVVGILGILRAGAAYLPLDPAYPADRLAYMLEDSGAPVVVTTSALADRVPSGPSLLRLDEDEDVSAGPVTSGAGPDALAYVIYTSGSTGRPKGVQVTHGDVLRLFDATDAWFGFGPEDAWTLFHSYAFDFSVWELWGALLYGGRLVVVPFEVSRAPADFLRLLADARVTVLNQTPSAFRQLMHADADAAARGDAPVLALREVIFGGEALDPASLRGWVERRGDGAPRLVNMYGITETTVHVTSRVIREADVRAGSASPIGVPIPDLSVHVRDGRGELLPLGVVGEMHVGGAGVARGYLGRPALTAERFVPDPFGAHPGARLYRSGDLARRLPDGSLEFFGRADDQVKVRGFRIELGEIESVLLEHPAVREAVVLPRGAGDALRLVAWVVGGDVSAAELRAHLLARVPEYMVPSAFVPMDALPLTRNGKVDRRALPDPDAADVAGAAYVAPRTETEARLAAAWAELLGVDRVGAEDGFFDLGGHSLLATRVVSRVREEFGVELPVRAVFEHPVLAALAAEVDARRRDAGALDAPPMVAVPRDGDLPLSFAQERLWFVQRVEGDTPAYHMPFAYRLTGPLDGDALRRAVDEVVRRHESLRTRFPEVDGIPVQRIDPAAPVRIPLHDLSHVAEEERDEAAGRIAAAHAGDPFDLSAGPLFRAALVRLAADDHLLLVNLHHVVADGWSTGILWTELSTLYGAFAADDESPLPEPPLQYADFAAWQRAWLTGDALERQLAYWRGKLAGAPPLLDLPADRPRPPVQRHRGAAASVVLDAEAAARVHALARSEGATLFMVLLAALDVVLARLSGQEDIVVGTPIAGRTRAETEGMIGLFLNSLALRTDLSGDPTFARLLARVRDATLEAYAHQDLPFERILEEIRPARSLAHAPVFQVMLNLANFGEGEVRLPGLQVAPLGAGGELAAKFDLTVYAGETPDGGLYLHLVYDADLFDAPRMEQVAEQLVAVLHEGARDASRPVSSISLVTEFARAALPDPARPIAPEPWTMAVHERVADVASRTPNAVAVRGGGDAWTYAELDAAADRTARRLRDAGVGAEDVVAVYAHRSAPLVRALLATWKAGAAFAVLDPAYPPARLEAYVRAARPAALLRIDAAGPLPAEVAAAVAETARVDLAIDGMDEDVDGADAAAPFAPVPAAPDALAYLAFTSGTTGTPKPVAGTHRPLAHFFGWYARTFRVDARDRVPLLAGLAHDPLLRDVFAPLWAGGTVLVPDPEEMGTPGWLAEWMRDQGATVAHLTPAMAALVTGTAEGVVLPALRLACFGGDVLRADTVRALRRTAPGVRAVNFYGATETPQAVAFHPVPEDGGEGVLPVGRGIDGVDLLVLTRSGAPAGVGEVGEIAVRTPYLARGYRGDDALTAERFVPNPATGDEADRVYRTGDLGRYRPDGAVEIAGRADRQVKVRGFRVEPGEIEAALRAHPAVRDAVVAARGEGEGRRLVAWVAGPERVDAATLREHLRGRLPEHLVPAALAWLDRIPLTPNGKVDRAALPHPEPAAPASAAPLSATAEALAAVWAELLPRARTPGAADDFFALGGHSLLATRLSARVRRVFGVELPLRDVFAHPRLAEMAAEVERRLRGADGAEALPPIVPVPRGETMPASFQQERMWFVDRMEGGGPVYAMPSAHHLRGPMDVDALRRAVAALVRRHETLRTALPEVDGRPVQRILPAGPVDVPLHDLAALAEPARAEAFTRLAEENARGGFDLEAGPLFRVSLVRLAPEEHVLLLSIHHAVSDGWSNRILVSELTRLYEAFRTDADDPLPPLPVQYADYAAWQRAHLAPRVDAQLAYWRDALAGAPPLLRLPTDHPRPEVQGHRGASEVRAVAAETLEALRALGREEGATLFMVLLAAFGAVLSRLSGQQDVVVGTPVAGRTRAETEGMIGLFLNSLALRADLGGDPSFRALLARVRRTTLQAYAHQDVPFERVLEAVQPPRSLAHAPVFQVMLNLLNFAEAEGGAGGVEVTGLGAGAQVASKFDLTLYAAETADGLALHLVYDADLFGAPRMRALLAQLDAVLRQAVADADRPVSALTLAEGEGAPPAADAVVRTPAGLPAGIGEPGAVWAPGADGVLRPTGARGRPRPDGSVEPVEDADPDSDVAPPARAGGDAEVPGEAAPRPPRTATERAVAAAWGEVLGIDADGIAADEDFFARGGHSLRATQVLARIRARFGVRLPLRAFFQAPTVAGLAAAVDAARGTDAAATEASAPEAPPAYPDGVFPLSFAQQRLWLLGRLGPTTAYNLPGALRFRGPLDAWALERALDEIVRRHEPLRSRIEMRGDEPVQVVAPPRPFRLRAEEVDGADDPLAAYRGMLEAEAARAFPAEGPFFRARLVRAAEDDHLLLWTMHHLVGDGWSAGVFRRELAALYRAFTADEGSPLPPLPVRYGEVAMRQRAELGGPGVAALEAYWTEAMAGAPPALELPADRPRPAEPDPRGATVSFALPDGASEAVDALARATGATPFMVLLAAFQLLLSRWSGGEDVVVGTAVAGRDREEVEPLIGFFSGTLALRTDLAGDPSFSTLLARVRETALGAFAHQELPFERLVELVNPPRMLGQTPIFQAMFVLQDAGEAAAGPVAAADPFGAVRAEPVGRERHEVRFDLSLSLQRQGWRTVGALDYRTALFDRETMEALARQFGRVLEQALADPSRPLSAIRLTDEAERIALASWNRPPEDTGDTTVLDRIGGWIARTPDAPAVAYEGEGLTYRALGERADRVARALAARGIGAEDRVGLCAERSAEAIVGMLAILRAGAAYVPVDPAFPPARIADVLGDAGVSLVLVQPHLSGLVASAGGTPLAIGDAAEERHDEVALPAVDGRRLAYVVYTSGSTGRPKGVAVEHRQLAGYVAAVAPRVGMEDGASWATVSTLAADLGHTAVFGALCGGGCLHVLAAERVADADAFAAYLARHPVDGMKITPSHLAALASGADPAGVLPRRWLVLGGEAADRAWVERIASLAPDLRIVNHYGPTETTVGALARPVARPLPETASGTVPIGLPLANSTARVVDPHGNEQPAGLSGELVIGGRGVARGYLRRAALTAERFVPDPFAPEPGARIYRTGDRVRRLRDGSVEFLGRIDQQVKVRGFRVEPGEVESALRAHPAVREVAVAARPDAAGTVALVAWVVPDGAEVDAEVLRAHCTARLPAYMVPAAFVPMEALPLTPNGKVDRAALPAPDRAGGDGYVVPRDVTELEVARIWAEVLGVPRVGAADDFFRLGGHSLLALRMISRVRARFGRDVPLATLFRDASVAAFAAALRGEGGADEERLLVTLSAGGASDPLFFFPPAGGTVTHYAELARLLGADRPFHALQAPGVSGAEAPLDSVEALAERFVDEIRAVRPSGPYLLGGWSAGGITALEAARRLRSAGDEVALVALLDTPPPDRSREGTAPDGVALFRRFARSTVTGDEALLDALEAELRAVADEERLPVLARWIARHGGQVRDDELARVARVMRVYEASSRAVRAYALDAPYDGPVALFRAAAPPPEETVPLDERWRPFLAGPRTVHTVPGVHAQMVLPPAVEVLAAELRGVLKGTAGER